MTTTQSGYMLGSKDDELDRLDLQAGLPHGDGAALSQRTLDRVLAAFRAAGVPTDRGYDLGRVSAVPVSVRRR